MFWCWWGVLTGRVKGEELEQEFGLCYSDRAVRIVHEVEAEEAGRVAVKGDLIVLPDVGDDRVDVGRGVAEYEGIVDVYNYISCLGCGSLVKQAVVECRHCVFLGKKSGLVVLVEQSAGVWEAVQGVGDAILLSGVQTAYCCDMWLQGCNDPVSFRWEGGVEIG